MADKQYPFDYNNRELEEEIRKLAFRIKENTLKRMFDDVHANKVSVDLGLAELQERRAKKINRASLMLSLVAVGIAVWGTVSNSLENKRWQQAEIRKFDELINKIVVMRK